MSDSREKTMRLTRIALLIAMNCISAYLIIPLPFSQSPIALQTLVVNLVAFLLPPKDAAITMLAYIGIGLIGVPVFRRYGRSGQDVRPDRWLHLGLRRSGLPYVLVQRKGL